MFETTIIPANERPRMRYRYTVRGSGTFPTDMLRYDAAYPSRAESIDGLRPSPESRTVELSSYKRPTEDRWRSFGWLVDFEG